MSGQVILNTDFKDLKLMSRGKVRDMYDCGDTLLIGATDRISAFDVGLTDGIPCKGAVLSQMSAYWFAALSDVIDNHLLSADPAAFPTQCRAHAQTLQGRAMLVKKAKPLPVECVVRGTLPVRDGPSISGAAPSAAYPLRRGCRSLPGWSSLFSPPPPRPSRERMTRT